MQAMYATSSGGDLSNARSVIDLTGGDEPILPLADSTGSSGSTHEPDSYFLTFNCHIWDPEHNTRPKSHIPHGLNHNIGLERTDEKNSQISHEPPHDKSQIETPHVLICSNNAWWNNITIKNKTNVGSS